MITEQTVEFFSPTVRVQSTVLQNGTKKTQSHVFWAKMPSRTNTKITQFSPTFKKNQKFFTDIGQKTTVEVFLPTVLYGTIL